MEAGVNHENFSGHGPTGPTEQKDRGIGYLARLHVAAKRRSVAVHLEDARKA